MSNYKREVSINLKVLLDSDNEEDFIAEIKTENIVFTIKDKLENLKNENNNSLWKKLKEKYSMNLCVKEYSNIIEAFVKLMEANIFKN